MLSFGGLGPECMQHVLRPHTMPIDVEVWGLRLCMYIYICYICVCICICVDMDRLRRKMCYSNMG